MRIQKILGLLAVLCAPFSAPALAEDCAPLRMVNSVQMVRESDGARDLVPVRFKEKELQFLFDTGGVTTMIGKKAARDMNLSIHQGDSEFYDLTGNISRDATTVPEFVLGFMRGADFTFPVSPGSDDGEGGIFSLNFMLPYDVEIDFGNDKLNFFDKKHCEGKILYWPASTVAVLPITIRDGHMTVPVSLEGHTFTAVIDTGATYSTLRMDLAKRNYELTLGDQNTPETGTLNGDQSLKTYTHIFDALNFGDVGVKNARVTIMPDAVNRHGDRTSQTGTRTKQIRDEIVAPEMIIGMNILRHLHLYMAFGERKIYITPASAPQTAPSQ